MNCILVTSQYINLEVNNYPAFLTALKWGGGLFIMSSQHPLIITEFGYVEWSVVTSKIICRWGSLSGSVV